MVHYVIMNGLRTVHIIAYQLTGDTCGSRIIDQDRIHECGYLIIAYLINTCLQLLAAMFKIKLLYILLYIEIWCTVTDHWEQMSI